MPDNAKTTEEESVFLGLAQAALMWATDRTRLDVFKTFKIEPREFAKVIAMLFQATEDGPTDTERPIFETPELRKAGQKLYGDAMYYGMVVGVVCGMQANGSMTMELSDAETNRVLKEELAKQRGRLGKTGAGKKGAAGLVRQRRNGGRRLR